MKRLFVVILSALLLLSMVPVFSSAEEIPLTAHVTEVPEGYTPVYTLEDLDNMRIDLSGKYILMNDLTFTEDDYAVGGDFYNNGKGWEPIRVFTGIFDGNYYKINNLKIIASQNDYRGLFGYIEGGTIKNVILEDVYVFGKQKVGGLVGYAIYNSRIENCSVSGNVKGSGYVGGICGYVLGTNQKNTYISCCSNEATVTATSSSLSSYCGGIVGYIEGYTYSIRSSIKNSYSSGETLFGICGTAKNASIQYCYAVSSNSFGNISTELTITSCFYLGTEGDLAKSEDQLRKRSTFTNWDFDTVWFIDKNSEYPFPQFRWMQIDNGCVHRNTIIQNQVDETCGVNGYSGDLYCQDCGVLLEAGTEIPATGAHSEVNVPATEPTCTKPGYSAYTYCSVCEAILTERTEIPANGHTETTVGAKEATCGKDGFTGVTYCTVCEKVLSSGTVIPATGEHTETIVGAIPALCGRDGFTGVTYCTVCEKVLDVGTSIPATGKHTGGETEETILSAPTCSTNGQKKVMVKCVVCDETLLDTVQTISATDHIDTDFDGICDECGEPLTDEQITSLCKYCGKAHDNTLFGRITKFFHNIFYLLAHMFGFR